MGVGSEAGDGGDAGGGFGFPPPPATKTFNAGALRLYRRTKDAYDGNAELAALLGRLRGGDQRPSIFSRLYGGCMVVVW